MSYGSSNLGSVSVGGALDTGQVFFPMALREPDVEYEAIAFVDTEENYYSVFTRQASEPGSGSAGVVHRIYNSHGEGETPQLQVTVEGNAQAVIGAAPIIVVRTIIDGITWAGGQYFSVTGRPGD